MIVVEEEEARRLLEWPDLVKAIREAFRGGVDSPPKHQHYVEVPGEPEGKIMMMPAWRSGEYVCIKLVNMFPGNADRNLPSVSGIVVLFDGRTGELLAQIDGGEITARRTAATSALAADYLALKEASTHLVVGTGRVAWNLIQAYRAVRPIKSTLIWGRNADKANEMALAAGKMNISVEAVVDLEKAVGQVDIISCATFTAEPLVLGSWLAYGAHLDLVGGYKPDVRETDDASIQRGTVFCDSLTGAPNAAGDLVKPLEAGLLRIEDIVDLHALVKGIHPGRMCKNEITVFKSVGVSLEDFAAAVLVYEESTGNYLS